MAEVLPVIFFGHGNPMNAVQNNRYTQGWRGIGKQIRKPKAILSISAVFPGNCTKCNTQLREIPIWHAVFNSCWPQCRCIWTTPGVWITEPGPCSVTFIRAPMFPWCS